MIVLVTGGRNYSDIDRVFETLDQVDAKTPITRIVVGDARGADEFAAEWTAARCRACVIYKADWLKHGRSAGPRRNQKMLDDSKPSLVVAFPGGSGTADMVSRATKAGVRVMTITDGGES